MKPVMIIVLSFVLLISIPNNAEASNETVCKALSTDQTPYGPKLNQADYEKCIEKYEKDDFWRSMRPWGLGIFFLVLFSMIGILGLKGRSKTTTHTTTSHGTLPKGYGTTSYEPTSHGTLPKGYETASQSGELNETDLQNNFQRYTWEQAEDIVGKLFEKKGYVVTVGVPTADGRRKRQGDFGIDVEVKNATEYLGIQVKHWNNDIGFEDVAKTLGVAQKFNKVIIVSTKSGFTSQARKHADDNPYLIELWDSAKFKQELQQYLLM